MSYTTPSAAYWQARANQCTQFADEGACLARVSRFAPVTIEPGFSGLGQADYSTLTTMAPRSRDLISLQTSLMNAGLLSIRTADGVIDSDGSPTLAAIRSWATSNGLSATGVSRSSNGGLVIPAGLAAGILGGASVTKIVGPAPAPSTALPAFDAEPRSGSGVPYAIVGVTTLFAIGIALWVSQRR